MIIGYNFFANSFHSTVFDTAIPTSDIDEVVMGAGIYDELFVSVDTSIGDEDVKPTSWAIKTIMDAKFNGNLEAGSIDADGHVVTKIQIYRRKFEETTAWILLGEFPYDIDFNMYSFVDRLAENDVTYEYAIVPVANEVLGDITISQPIKVNYEGVWISDLENNFQLEYDFRLDSVSHNRNYAKQEPLNGRYPIVTFGTQQYRSGGLTFLPLSDEQIKHGGTKINSKTERLARESVLDFLNKSSAKVIRNDNGSIMVVATHDVSEEPREGSLIDISDIKFSYTEIGEFDYDTMSKGGLIGEALKSKYSFDEDGNVIWSMGANPRSKVENEMRHRNTFKKD
ncbi:hypothetical protein [Vagococcus fluvialis]|uniref:hypothetical protein n=1 Tax=Vagococcus fluvialis TaxID=2738 RepID=UPI001D0B3993|nr:hypothetical protein [Vagococcus fluvialis]UDM72726.1 hypothetical protein K5L00_14300 [Vagococcus fluvialis]UDM78448.1 hypothetical protein K5K98_14505 [Vagococcus fluvialis]UDM84001.1 hypothetical protein K5K96_14325 [Vagococcus fluvialis]